MTAVSVASCKGTANSKRDAAMQFSPFPLAATPRTLRLQLSACLLLQFLWLAVRAQLAKIFAHVLTILGPFLINFGLPGVPGMALGTLDDHLCAGTPENVDFSCLWGPCRSPLGDPAGTLFRLWIPPGPSWRAFGSDV